MTQIDFYILGCGPEEAKDFACRLTEKAFQSGHRIHVHARSIADARELDQRLWTFRAGSFVPHELVDTDATAAPVTIGAQNIPASQSDVLINLTDELPPDYQRFGRIAEVIAGTDACKSAARERFRTYKQRGHAVQSHKIEA